MTMTYPMRHARLNERVQKILAQLRRHVVLYRDTPFYTQNRPSLQDHIDSGLEKFDALPSVRRILSREQGGNLRSYLYCLAVRHLFEHHDDGEIFGEVQSFSQKALGADLKSTLSAYERTASRVGYAIACVYAVQGRDHEGYEHLRGIQLSIQKAMTDFSTSQTTAEAYEEMLDSLIDRLHEEEFEAIKTIDETDQLTEVMGCVHDYVIGFISCETVLKHVESKTLLVKLWDKNCTMYLENARKNLPGNLPLHREPNKLAIKTLQRGLALLPDFMHMVEEDVFEGEVDAALVRDVRHYVLQRAETYVALGKPFLFLDDALAKGEPKPEAPESDYYAFNAAIREAWEERRQHTHPLDDDAVLAAPEMQAKLCLMRLLDTQTTDIFKPGLAELKKFRNEYDWILDGLTGSRPPQQSLQRSLFPGL